MATIPARFAEIGDHAGIDDAVFAIDELLEWAARDEAAGAEVPTSPPTEARAQATRPLCRSPPVSASAGPPLRG